MFFMKHILILNGPNLNLLGQRDPDIYGTLTYEELNQKILEHTTSLEGKVSFFQSNHEGDLIDQVQQAASNFFDGIIINPGALTHYSYALHDAIEAISLPVIEVHLSHLSERKETWRHTSVIAPVVTDRFMGEGLISYLKAISRFFDQ